MAMTTGQMRQLLAGLEKARRQLPQWLEQTLLREGLRAMAEARRLTPVDTGLLRRNWSVEATGTAGGAISVTLTNPTGYASFVEYGHGSRAGNWVPGRWMGTIAIEKVRSGLPAHLEKEFTQWLATLGWGG